VGTLRVALVGTGFAARIHASCWRRCTTTEVSLAAVVSSQLGRAESFAAEVGAQRACSDLDQLLSDPGIDALDLCVPNHLHAELGRRALEAGKHLVVEKPLTGCFDDPAATSGEQMLERALASADSLVAEARQRGLAVCYAENWLYAPAVAKAAELAATAGGPILRICGEESHSGTHSPANKAWSSAGGGSLLGKACHPLGAALHLKAEEGRRRGGRPLQPTRVTASCARLTSSPAFLEGPASPIGSGYLDVEDWGLMVVTFEDGTVAELVGSDVVLGGVRNQLSLFCSNAVVEASLSPEGSVRAFAPDPSAFAEAYLVEKLETKAGWSQPSPDEHWAQGYPQELADFAQAILQGRPPRSDGTLGRQVVAVVYAAYLSARSGRAVELGPWLGRPT
jgi:predicted dehydrogenase